MTRSGKARPGPLLLLLLLALGSAPVWLPGRACGQAAPRSQHLALLVGISAYDQSGSTQGLVPWPPLHSEPDLQRLTTALLHLGFAAADIVVLRDQQASRQNIRDAVRTHLIERATPGAQVVFHFSGHGQQLADDGDDEIDGLDETLVPGDARDQRAAAGEKSNIRDDEVGRWLRALQSRMRVAGKVHGSIMFSFDTCFAGTLTRGSWEERGRGWDPSLDGPPPLGVAAHARRPALAIAEASGEFVALSAARSDQTARGNGDGGLFSTALAETLLRATSETTYRALMDEITDTVEGQTHSRQSPQLEGQAEQRVLGGRAPPWTPYHRVSGFDGQMLTLPVGQPHLVTVGSRYAIHRAGSGPPGPGTLLAEALVERVWPLYSELRLLPETALGPLSADTLRGARALELRHHYSDSPLRLRSSGLEGVPGLARQLGELGFLGSAAMAKTDYDVELRARAGQLELLRPESRAPVAKWPLSRASIAAVTEALHSEWRWLRLHRLTGGNRATRVSVVLVPLVVAAAPPGRPPRAWPAPPARWGNDLQLPEDSFFTIQLQNASDKDLYVTILELGPSGEIRRSFPSRYRPGDQLIARRSTVMLPLDPYMYRAASPCGRSLFRVLTTTAPVDFAGLIQRADAARSAGEDVGRGKERADALAGVPADWQPLAALLYDMVAGERLGPSVQVSQLGWGTSTARLEIVPSR